MGVFSKIGGFFNRHRNKFVVGGIIVTGSVLLTRYAQHKLREWQQNEAREFFERTRKQQHFESTERTCNQTIISLINPLVEALNKGIDTEDVIAELRNNPENKLELWDQLKVLVFTKVSCLVYVSSLLVTLLRVQMNVIGGYLYKDPVCIPFETQQKYLSLCHNLFETGTKKLAQVLEEEYKKIMHVIPLKKQLKIDDLEKIFWAVQAAVKENKDDPICNFKLYAVSEDLTDEKDIFKCMVQDTIDLLESDEVKNLASSCVSRCFSLLGDQIAEFYGPNSGGSGRSLENPTRGPESFVHPAEVRIPLAKLIPIINGLVSKHSLPNLFVQQLIINDHLKTLGANVYEAFSYNNNNSF